MAQRALVVDVEEERPPALYFRREYPAYECLGCQELIEIRKYADLMIDGAMQRVRIEGQPERFALWLEMHTLDHADCHKFKDAAAAKSFREHRKRALRKGRKP